MKDSKADNEKRCPKCKSVMEKAIRSNRYRCSTKRCANYSQRFR